MKELRNRALGLAILVSLVAAPISSVDALSPPEDLFDQAEPEQAEPEQAEEQSGEGQGQEEADGEEKLVKTVENWVNPLRNNLISQGMNTEGGAGFHHIASAVSPGPLMFQVGLLAEASGGRHVIRYNDQNRTFGGNVLVNGSITEHFGFHVGLQARNNLNSFGRPQAMLSQGDVGFGFTGRYEVAPGAWIGGDLSFFVPSGFGGLGLSAQSTSVRPRLLASFNIDELMGAADDLVVPVVLHTNVGFRFDNSENLVPEGTRLDRVERFAYGISAYNMVELGLGAEFPLPYVTPFLGWSFGIPVGGDDSLCSGDRALRCVDQVGAAAFPHKLSVGAKAEPLRNLGLHAGVDIGLTPTAAEGLPVTLPYNVVFGLSWNIDSRPVIQIEEREVEKIVEIGEPRGYLLGRLLDGRSGEPVSEARIVYVDRDESGHFSRQESGLFRTYDFEPGEEVTVEIHHPHYEVLRTSWVVEEGMQEIEFMLDPLPLEATLRGRIAGSAGAAVLIGDSAGNVFEVVLDEEGRFEQQVAPGVVTVAAMKEGFLTVGRDLQIAPDSENEIELAFDKEEGNIIVGVEESQLRVQDRLDFETGGSVLLESSFGVLDVVAAVLLENPQIRRLQIQGHTDDAGDDDYNVTLSQSRAEAVKKYLVEQGISPERLEAEGYGSTQPLVPNTSRRNRTLNRRIEFRVVDHQ